MDDNLKYIENVSLDVYFNLALEEYIFSHLKDDTYLLLWENDRSIVLGKNQNVFEEIDIKAVEEMGIKVARRITGGGTVFHDQGNLNYSFITDYDPNLLTDYDKFLNLVISALTSLGIHAAKRGTSDIAIDGKKISGSAQTTKAGRVLHHGTLLFDADLSMLNDLLKPAEGIVSKSVKSQRSVVTNIKEYIDDKTMITVDFKTLLLNALFPEGVQKFNLSEEHLDGIWELVENKYSGWQWNYGASPKFYFKKESKIRNGAVNIKLDVEKGIVTTCEITADLPCNTIETAIRGSLYSYKEILNRLVELKELESIKNINIEELASRFF